RIIGVGLAVLTLVGLSAPAMPFVKNWWAPQSAEQTSAQATAYRPAGREPGRLELNAETVQALGLRTTEAHPVTQPRRLEMFGQLDRDQDRLFRVRARFVGDVIEIGQVPDRSAAGSLASPTRARSLQ